MDEKNKMVPMPGIEKLQERANEVLLDHFVAVCMVMCYQENTTGRITKKVEADYNETKARILALMNKGGVNEQP